MLQKWMNLFSVHSKKVIWRKKFDCINFLLAILIISYRNSGPYMFEKQIELYWLPECGREKKISLSPA